MNLSESEVTEMLAEICHDQGSNWMKYLFSKCLLEKGQFDKETGNLLIPQWAVERWQRQMNTAYEDLPNAEKISDQQEAKKMALLIGQKMNNKGEIKMNDEIVDVSNMVDEEEMPLCPLCDNDMDNMDDLQLVKAHGLFALAHNFCVEEFVNRD